MTRIDLLAAIGFDRASGDRDDGPAEPLWSRTLSLVFTIAVIAVGLYLWPATLGGSTRLVIVSGRSMEPTYDLGDIVVVRDSGDTQIGDVVVFEVAEGEAEGMLVIHRVLYVDDDGFFITQGDNRTTPDQWQLSEEDIVGKPLAHIPKGGAAFGLIQNVWLIALLAGVIALCLLWPDGDDELDELDDVDDETEPVARGAPATQLAETWLDGEFGNDFDARLDDEVMAEAMAWLDEQLSDVEHLVSH